MDYAYKNEAVGYAQSASLSTTGNSMGQRETALTMFAARLEALTKALAGLEIDVGRNAVRTFGARPEAVEPVSESTMKHDSCSLGRIEAAIREAERVAQKLGAQCRRFDDL